MMRMMRGCHVLLGVTVFLAACGHGAGEKIRPKEITGQDALGMAASACSGEPKLAKPLIVDLEASARVELESAMKKKGVVVVAYDCRSLTILRSCQLAGATAQYDYGGVDPHESVVQMKNQEELSVNLPLSSAKLGGEVASGRSIDLAMIFRGLKTSSVDKVERQTLTGNCEGATHFIRAATIGAFSMATGSAGKATAAAEVFKLGASGSSEASRNSLNRDGSIEACRSTDLDSAEPPSGCRSPLLVELQPIGSASVEQDKPKQAQKNEEKAPIPEENPCRDGYVYAKGLCTKSLEEAHICKPSDEDECRTQCEKGSAESCYNLAAHTWFSNGKRQSGYEAFKKSCEKGFAEGCGYQAELMGRNDVVTGLTAEQLHAEQVRLTQRGCDAGGAESCGRLGLYLSYGKTKETKRAIAAFQRSCRFGSGVNCGRAGVAYAKGSPEEGIAPDLSLAIDYASRMCKVPTDYRCVDLGKVYFFGHDAAKGYSTIEKVCADGNLCESAITALSFASLYAEALQVSERLCQREAKRCDVAARSWELGFAGQTKDLIKAQQLYQKSCDAGHADQACKKAAELKLAGAPPPTPLKKPTPPKKKN